MAFAAFGLLAVVAVLFSGTESADPCCTFASSECYWTSTVDGKDNYQWTWSGIDVPTIQPLGFDTPRHSGYMWLQDLALAGYANATAKSSTFVLHHDDYLSIDIYRYIVYYDGGSRPVLYFHDQTSGNSLALDIEWDPDWVTNRWQCGDSVICCVEYPCQGYLEMVGILYDRTELLAFDNIGINGVCVDPELPTCCTFDTSTGLDSCSGYTPLGWFHYPDNVPDTTHTKYPIIDHGSDYEWAQDINAATLSSSALTGITSTSIFSFEYYGDITGSSSYMSVAFETTDGFSYPLANLGDTIGAWAYYTVDCSVRSCCGAAGRCDGRLVFTTYYPSGPPEYVLFGVDNIESDGGCGDPTCCSFSTSDFCGWTDDSSALPWKWSGIATPDTSILSPDFIPEAGEYAWFQLDGGVADPQAVLVSPPITNVDNAFYFSVDFYVEANPAVSTNALYVYFQEDGGYDKVLLTTLYITGTEWLSESFPCSGLGTGSCCAGGSGSICTGHLELDASGASGVVFYAIDNVDINGHCL